MVIFNVLICNLQIFCKYKGYIYFRYKYLKHFIGQITKSQILHKTEPVLTKLFLKCIVENHTLTIIKYISHKKYY